mgnify:CR=1 FL=1
MEPGTPIRYERVDDTVYGRFSGRPDIPRWVVTQENLAKIPLTLKDYQAILELSKNNPALKRALDNLILVYNMVKDGK